MIVLSAVQQAHNLTHYQYYCPQLYTYRKGRKEERERERERERGKERERQTLISCLGVEMSRKLAMSLYKLIAFVPNITQLSTWSHLQLFTL